MIDSGWKTALLPAFKEKSFAELRDFVKGERAAGHCVYPQEEEVFSAFSLAPFESVKVVVIGQDPYHTPGAAHGLSFSVKKGVKVPPSLQNIFTELSKDIGFTKPNHGCLEAWAKQGVLLLNTVMTVRKGEPQSHKGKGWEVFTKEVVIALLKRDKPLVFMIWGKAALHNYSFLLDIKDPKILVLLAAHPSPYSVQGFFGCQHFSKANAHLEKWKETPINWNLDS